LNTPRDAGLVRGITTTGLAASVVNSVVGVSIFTLPAVVALEAGAAAPIAYLLTAVIMAGVTICFAEAGSRVPTSGGAYGSVEAAFGPAAGFVVGILFLVSDALASGGIAAALADMVSAMLPGLSGEFARTGMILAVYGLVVWVNLLSVKTTARLIALASIVKAAPLVLFLVLGICSLGHAAPAGQGSPPPVNFAGFGRALILTLFAFQGMEIALGASGEVRDPCRTLPRALFIAMLLVLGLYLGVQLSAQHILGSGLATATAPLAEAAGRFGWPLKAAMFVGAGLSMLGYMAGDVLGTSRMVFALARDGRLPRALGHVRATGVPARAVLAYAAAAFLLAVTGSFLELVTLSALATVAIYILVCAAAVLLRRRNVAQAGTPLGIPGLAVAASVGLAGMAGMLVSARWQEIAGLAALIGGTLAAYALIARRNPGQA
jgi:amino acid transporter